jgi:hypothetical protein
VKNLRRFWNWLDPFVLWMLSAVIMAVNGVLSFIWGFPEFGIAAFAFSAACSANARCTDLEAIVAEQDHALFHLIQDAVLQKLNAQREQAENN